MWSLPDIRRMNEDAAANGDSLYKQADELVDSDGEPALCENCGEKASSSEVWFDIFSDDPKGIIFRCADCGGEVGDIPEGYFRCDGCDRVFTENYTWELYYHAYYGELYCLNCWRKKWLEDDDHWFDLTDEGVIDMLNFESIREAPHLIAVGQPCPPELDQIGKSVTLDSMSGGEVTGSSSSMPTPDSAVEKIRGLLRQARREGHDKAILILDAAWQFAVDIGVYVPAED